MSFCRPYKTLTNGTNGTITSNQLFVAEDTLESQDQHSEKLKDQVPAPQLELKVLLGSVLWVGWSEVLDWNGARSVCMQSIGSHSMPFSFLYHRLGPKKLVYG
jgi:hypothetical protein